MNKKIGQAGVILFQCLKSTEADQRLQNTDQNFQMPLTMPFTSIIKL